MHYPKHVFIAIHGVRRGNAWTWQHGIQAYLEKNCPDCVVIPFVYDSIFAFQGFGLAAIRKIGFKWIGDREIRGFASFLKDVANTYPETPISIVAHSNGTFITHEALYGGPAKINSVVFIQPVTSRRLRKTNFEMLFKAGILKRLYVWSSKNDTVIGKLVRWVSLNGHLPGYGMAGYSGMVRDGYDDDLKYCPPQKPYPDFDIFNTVTNETHGGVLDKLDVYGPLIMSQLKGK